MFQEPPAYEVSVAVGPLIREATPITLQFTCVDTPLW